MNARQIVQAHREKTEIEDAFKNMKSFLKIRPPFVNTDQRGRAVFTICVLAYHINKTLANKRKQKEGKDYLLVHSLLSTPWPPIHAIMYDIPIDPGSPIPVDTGIG